MEFRFAKLTLPLIALIVVATLPSLGQQQRRSGERIIFSTPAGDSAATSGPIPQSAPAQSGIADEIQAPMPLLKSAPGPILPPPPNYGNLRKMLDSRKDWALMTPAEIMGVTTPAKLLGAPESEKDRDLTPEQRYLQRQDEEMSPTNGFNNQSAASRWLSRNREASDFSNPWKSSDRPNDASSPTANGFFETAPNENPFTGVQNSTSGKALGLTPLVPNEPLQAQAQQDEMERFRKLLGTAARVEKPEKPFAPSTPVLDPNLNVRPFMNPSGGSYTPLQNNVNRPMGINPLPTLTGSRSTKPEEKPSWAPKPPPWLSDQPQMPQRKF